MSLQALNDSKRTLTIKCLQSYSTSDSMSEFLRSSKQISCLLVH